MSRVLDSGRNGFQGDGNLGFGDDEIMVEIVGSDVFVDGVSGNEMSRNGGGFRELGNGGVIGEGGFEGNVCGGDFLGEGVGVEDYGVIEDVMFLEDGSGLGRRDEVTESGGMGCGNEERLGGRDEVGGSGDTGGCEMTTPSGHGCSGARDEALSCDSEVSGGNCVVATGLSSGEAEVIGEKMNCCFNEDTMEPMVESSDASTDSGFRRSYSEIAMTEDISEQVSVEVKERGLNGKDQVVCNIVLDAESLFLQTVRSTSVERVIVETDTGTTCGNTESGDHPIEAVAGVNEILNNNKETLQSGPKIIESDVFNGNLQCSVGEGQMSKNLVTESSGDHVDVSVDSVSSQKPAKLVLDSQVADDDDKVCNKGIETCKSVDFSEGSGDYGNGTETFPDLVSTIEHTQIVAGYDEVICNKIATVNEIEMTTNDSLLPNPMSEVSDIKAVQCAPKYADAGKDCKEVLISEIEVSEMNLEEATKYAPGVGLSVCGGDNSSFEVTLKRTEVLDLKEDPTFGVDCISGCLKEVQNMECDPVAEKGDSPTIEESIKRQGLVSESGPVQHMKAVESFENDVAQEQHDIVILAKGIVETISDEKMDTISKTMVLDGDTNVVKVTNLSGLDSRGSGAVNEEKKDDMQNPDVKRRGSLGCEDGEDKILNQPLTGEILIEGHSDPAIPHITGEVTYGPEAVLSSDMWHREGKAVHCNQNSIVNVMSDGVTSDELVHLTFQRRDNKPVMGSLVDNMGTLCNEEEKKLQGEHLDGNISLGHELNCVDSNVHGTERNIDLQFSECLDANLTGNHTGVSSDEDHVLEVKYDEEQVDAHTDQEMEIQDETINIGESEVIDKKTAEQVSSRSASSISEFHSRYLLPPNNDGEFSVGDLVWSKDRSLPWWPGQIFNPADVSEKAMKHHKNGCFLVAYFGIRTFAWNDTSRIRPFRTHFSQIEGQRNSEACHQAVNCALVEISRRVQLSLSCLCIPRNSFVKVESQIVENIGILQEAGRRFHVDKSTAASCFEPGELLEHIRSLALLPSASCDDRLQLTISKAQVAAFSRFKRHHPLPEFHLCIGLLENDADTSSLGDVFQEHSEQVKGENSASNKRKRDLADSLPPRKKDRSMSELIGDMPQSDSEEECDDDIRNSSVTSSAARKRKALESVTDGSSKRQVYYAAKVSTSTNASQIPKKSLKIGECILRVASQLTGSPSPVKCNSEKFLETDDGVDQYHGFDHLLQTSVNSQQGMMLSLKHISMDEMLSRLHLTAQDPLKNYSFLNEITSFFSGFRQSVMGQKSRRWNQPLGRDSEKNKAPQSNINPPEDFEFDDTNDSYWADRIVQNYDEEQILDRGQNGEAENQPVPNEADLEQIFDRGQNGEVENQLVPNEADKEQMLDTAQYGEPKSQLVPSEADKPVKSGRRSRKRFSSGKQVMVAEKPVEDHTDVRRPDCTPTELILKFTEGKFVPSELNLIKIFRRFGPIREPETEIDRVSSCAKVVYKRCSDAKVALSSAGIFNIFGPMLVSYELSYVPSAPFKTLPAATVQDREDAS